jgi:asparagine synthase (glutamine-hydrolysing)
MCGIAGILDPARSSDSATLNACATRMADALAHRGPDDRGTWHDAEAGIAFGHRRLAIIDLSLHGHQPMTSASGRYVIVYNGEIYNHVDMRGEVDAVEPGRRWRGHSDTEVLLAALDRFGIDGMLERANGMFAFAVWDRAGRVLHLARDRIGEKPLYFGTIGGRFAFASELGALRALPGFAARVDPKALALYLRLGYVPAPHSIHAGIEKLPPATRVEVRADGGTVELKRQVYWDLAAVAKRGLSEPRGDDRDLALGELHDRLERSVRQRMIADVPLGAFLSGGIDSSLIVAIMQRQSARPVRTFTIGFHDPEYDEAPYARAVAKHLRTDHSEVYVTAEQALAAVPRLPHVYDEPFADASQIPTLLVCEIARKHVTVALTGDGGDELFFGYERYVRTMRLGRLPAAVRRAAAAMLRRSSHARVGAVANALLPQAHQFSQASDKLAKLQAIMGAADPRAVYEGVVSRWADGTVPTATQVSNAGFVARDARNDLPLDAWMMLVDQQRYLPDDILVKTDRASMAMGLETRVPLLDHTLVEYAWALPLALKLREGRGKYLLRELLAQYVPRTLTDRPKRGFAVPLAQWLRGPLRDWAESLLDERRLREQGLLDADRVRARWNEHLSGVRSVPDDLWTVLALQSWLAEHQIR